MEAPEEGVPGRMGMGMDMVAAEQAQGLDLGGGISRAVRGRRTRREVRGKIGTTSGDAEPTF